MQYCQSLRSRFLAAWLGLLCLLGAVGSTAGKTIVFDDFSDGDARDAVPALWSGSLTVEGGDLVVRGTGSVRADLSSRDAYLADVSVRTQLRLVEGDTVGVSVRSGGGCYYGWVYPGLDRTGTAGIGRCSSTLDFLSNVSFNLDPKQQDIIMQVDSIGTETTLWIWPSDEAMPPEPVVSVVDDTRKEGSIYLWVTSSDAQGPGVGPAEAIFRYVVVGDAPLTDADLMLQAGDADQDLDFDQLDLVQVQVAAKYLTGQPATWGEGDWNGAPGGYVGNPPPGDGVFNQMDIVAAQQAGFYMAGRYGVLAGPTELVYRPVPEPSSLALIVLGLLGRVMAPGRRLNQAAQRPVVSSQKASVE